MHPKNILLSLLLTCLLLPLSAQSDCPELERRLADYARLTTTLQYDSLLEFIDPRLYELVPRATLLAQFEQLHADTNMRVRFVELATDVTEQSAQLAGDEYRLVRYRGRMEMEMVSADYRDPDFVSLLAGILAGQYGEENIDYSEDTHTFSVRMKKVMIAIQRAEAGGADAGAKPPKTSPWYLLEYRPEARELMVSIVPEAVYDQLKL